MAYSKLSESVQSGGMNSAACIQLSHLQTVSVMREYFCGGKKFQSVL